MKTKNIRPTAFKESNTTLAKPQGWTDKECGPLPIYNDGQQSISCWNVPFWHRLRILFTGRIWLGVVFGKAQPPVWLESKRPFYEPGFPVDTKEPIRRSRKQKVTT